MLFWLIINVTPYKQIAIQMLILKNPQKTLLYAQNFTRNNCVIEFNFIFKTLTSHRLTPPRITSGAWRTLQTYSEGSQVVWSFPLSIEAFQKSGCGFNIGWLTLRASSYYHQWNYIKVYRKNIRWTYTITWCAYRRVTDWLLGTDIYICIYIRYVCIWIIFRWDICSNIS